MLTPCSTGGRTGTVRPKHLPAGRTGLSDQFLGPIAQDQPGPVGQICPTSWLSLRSDSVRPTTGRTRLFEHRSSSRVRPVNAGSAGIIVLVLILVVWRIKTPAKAWVDHYNGTISTEEER
ncbi:hypothetical protein PCANC_05534 [Puccinia coronata f. sp. avenae]|uniref:Uncharacterized protein n=1 Tax=Puccinia coronata f. sp. avenae TaxID=200324 RepID=A0A2N5VP66_9BASI|nr:hypothetical protein PCANC_05534 [Puccinia coronata f. sp. avenae]